MSGMRLKAIGRRGSWFARVDGEELPCVHSHWLEGMQYYSPEWRVGDKKYDNLAEAIISSRRVILTESKVSYNGSVHSFERKNYVAVYLVDDIEVTEGCLKFQLVKKLVDLE